MAGCWSGRREAKLFPAELLFDFFPFGGAERAVELRRTDPACAEAVHLVLHQRDEGRDDDGGATRAHGRGLVAERLAAAGGEHDERIASQEDGGHRLFLQGPEGVETPVAGDDGPQVV